MVYVRCDKTFSYYYRRQCYTRLNIGSSSLSLNCFCCYRIRNKFSSRSFFFFSFLETFAAYELMYSVLFIPQPQYESTYSEHVQHPKKKREKETVRKPFHHFTADSFRRIYFGRNMAQFNLFRRSYSEWCIWLSEEKMVASRKHSKNKPNETKNSE